MPTRGTSGKSPGQKQKPSSRRKASTKTTRKIVFPRKKVSTKDGTTLQLADIGQWQRARWNYNDTDITAKNFRMSIWPELWYAYERQNTKTNLEYDRRLTQLEN
jgi:hypothetical protein